MRILVLTQYFWPENFRINDLVLASKDKAHHVEALTGKPNYPMGQFYVAVLLLFYQWDLYGFEWYWLAISGIFLFGTINAYNFTDGINGITGSYSLLAIITLLYINEQVIFFTSSNLSIIIGLSFVVFNIFKFRKKAKCSAGDVGIVSVAFIIVFLIGQLILKTHDFSYILLLLVYGLDTAFTVFFRKIRKENIFEAHCSHFYQFLANELNVPHLLVSGSSANLLAIASLFYTKNPKLKRWDEVIAPAVSWSTNYYSLY